MDGLTAFNLGLDQVQRRFQDTPRPSPAGSSVHWGREALKTSDTMLYTSGRTEAFTR